MTHDEMIAVIQAAKEGKTIESKAKFTAGGWGLSTSPGFNFNAYDYRVKPEPLETWAVADSNQIIYQSNRKNNEAEIKSLAETWNKRDTNPNRYRAVLMREVL